MMNKNNFLIALILILLLGALCVFNTDNKPEGKDNGGLGIEDANNPPRATHKIGDSSEKTQEKSDPEAEDTAMADTLKDLSKALPDWMDQKGMAFEEEIEIAGHKVRRSRVRHRWDEGQQMEIEISDVGIGAADEVVQSLGFDLNMDNELNEEGLREVVDEDGILTNYEYDFGSQSGSLQILYGERYMIEIKVEGLPEDSFQEILDRDVGFDELNKK